MHITWKLYDFFIWILVIIICILICAFTFYIYDVCLHHMYNYLHHFALLFASHVIFIRFVYTLTYILLILYCIIYIYIYIYIYIFAYIICTFVCIICTFICIIFTFMHHFYFVPVACTLVCSIKELFSQKICTFLPRSISQTSAWQTAPPPQLTRVRVGSCAPKSADSAKCRV